MSNGVIIPINYIERKPNSEQYRVVGKGVTVTLLATLIDHPDWPVERICANYNLTPAEVHAAWAFYYDHQDEIDGQIAATQSEPTPEDIAKRERVRERYQAKTGKPYPEDENG
jgi:uncharacterized protein (DUF433 family)